LGLVRRYQDKKAFMITASFDLKKYPNKSLENSLSVRQVGNLSYIFILGGVLKEHDDSLQIINLGDV